MELITLFMFIMTVIGARHLAQHKVWSEMDR